MQLSRSFMNMCGFCHDHISWFNQLGNTKFAGYPTFKGQVLDGKQLWDLIEGLEANNLLFYTHLLTGKCNVTHLHLLFHSLHKSRSVKMERGVTACEHNPSVACITKERRDG